MIGYNANITKTYQEDPTTSQRCKPKRSGLHVTETMPQLELPVLHDVNGNHIGETAVRSSRSSFIETLALSGAQSTRFSTTTTNTAIVIALAATIIIRILNIVWEIGDVRRWSIAMNRNLDRVGGRVSGISVMTVVSALCAMLPLMMTLQQQHQANS